MIRSAGPLRNYDKYVATETLILLGVGLYVVAMVGIGVLSARASHSLTDFVVAGRNMPVWLCSVSIFATWFGSAIMMGATTAAYTNDMLLIVGEPFGSGLCLLLTGLFFARIYRRTKRFTWIEFFEVRFGRVAGVASALADILASIIWLGGILFTVAVLLNSLAGIPFAIGVFGGLAVVVFYTMLGGMWAVAITDFVQSIALVLGLVVLLAIVLHDVGGWSAITAKLPPDAFRLIPKDNSLLHWAEHTEVWMALGVAAIASSSIIQRALSAKNEVVAQNSFYIAAAGYIIIGSIPLALGYIASVTMPDVADPNAVLTELAFAHLHPFLIVIFVGAIISAAMSTSDSVLLGVATIASTNLLPLVRRDASDALRLAVVRWTIPVAGLLATYIAFNADRAVQVLIDAAAVLLAAIIVPFVACFWWDRANRAGALASMAAGFVTWIGCSIAGTAFPADLIGFFVSLAVVVPATLLTQRLDPPRPLTDHDGAVVELKDRLGFARRDATDRA